MLYISHYVGRDNYCLRYVDFEGHKGSAETIVPASEIERVCTEHGQCIAGVDVRDEKCGSQKRVHDILAHQLPLKMSVLQTKLRVMNKVNVVVYDEIIANIRWSDVKTPVTINLADFGVVVGDRFLYGNESCKYNITLVFDDSLVISEHAFHSIGYRGRHDVLGEDGLKLYFDIREMSDDKAVIFYKRMHPERIDDEQLRQLSYDIVDDPHRKERLLSSLW